MTDHEALLAELHALTATQMQVEDDRAAQSAVDRAHAAVDLARQHLQATRRAFMDRQAGAADIATAEADLGQALDELDRINGVGWRPQP